MYTSHECLDMRASEEGVWISRVGVTGSCEPPHGCWEIILPSLEAQQLLAPNH